MKFRQIRPWGWPLLGDDLVLYSVQCTTATGVI